MEYIHGKSLKKIFSDNNWENFYELHKDKLRPAIAKNVVKMLICGTVALGYKWFSCHDCADVSKKVYYTCKSRFCSSCGKKATDKWIQDKLEKFPQTIWQHITFTIPADLWNFFWVNRHLMGKIPSLAASIILEEGEKRITLPGIFLAIHTFGRDLKRNMHLHLSTTTGGLSLSDYTTWIKGLYFDHKILKTRWRYLIIDLLRTEFKHNTLTLPPELKYIKNYKEFNNFLDKQYSKNWVVHLQKTSENQIQNIQYLGKYLKRPPIGETRIEKYENGMVTFNYLDHYTKETQRKTLTAEEFIEQTVTHIHDDNFRVIRYYGFLANRVIGKLLPIIIKACKPKFKFKKKDTSWRSLIIKTFNDDPLICPKCFKKMVLDKIVGPLKLSLERIQNMVFRGLL